MQLQILSKSAFKILVKCSDEHRQQVSNGVCQVHLCIRIRRFLTNNETGQSGTILGGV